MATPVLLLFSGQGAQAVGMARELFDDFGVARELAEGADEALDFSLTQTMFAGPIEELTRTSRCQPALYLHGLMALAALRQKAPDLQVVGAAGLSLGEFTAHAAAATFDFETGLRVVAQRGLFMEEACEATDGSMAAMIGGNEAAVRELAHEAGVDVANLNAPGQIVLSGSQEGIAKAVAGAKGKGIKLAKELTVAGAYHSRLMASAQSQLASELSTVSLSAPQFPVYCNVEASEVAEEGEIRDTLTRQVTGSVRWGESVAALLDRFPGAICLEMGPGKTLAGLLARIRKGAPVYGCGTTEGIERALDACA
ncbi:MAG: ACP S-malonyltransferase [Verrucomicrobiota bacterium]